VDDARDKGREFFLAVDKVGFVEGRDCGFENVVAEVVADGGLLLEAGKESAHDADDHDDRSGIAHADSCVAEDEDGFEDGGIAEDEVAHGRAVGIAAGFCVYAGEFCG
jgi:hypothetical protein